jgi:hypothetical protein
MSSSGQTIGGFFANLESELESAFNTVVTDVEQLAVAIGTEVENDVKALWAALAPVALQAIQDNATKVMTGEEKFGTAVTTVVQTAEAQGQSILIQDAQALVQNTFNWLRDKLTGQ